MTKAERVEIAAIFIAAGAVWALTAYFKPTLVSGEVCLIIASLLLLQGLIRDVYLVVRRRRDPSCELVPAKSINASDNASAPAGTTTEGTGAKCICLESTFGTFGIVIGAALLLFGGSSKAVTISPFAWAMMVLATGTIGFLLKSVVIDWKRRRLRIVTDHSKVRF